METNSGGQLEKKSRAASEAERRAWERVKGKHPGTSEHDPNAWAEWLAAASAVRTLAQSLHKLDIN